MRTLEENIKIKKNGIYTIRSITDRDHDWLIELHNDPVVLSNLTHPTPITKDHHLNWWKNLDRTKEVRMIFEINGTQ